MSAINLWLSRFAHQLLPSVCLWCQQPLAPDEPQLCSYCQQHLPRLDASLTQQNSLLLPPVQKGLSQARFDALYTLTWYQQPYRHWIQRWKFQQGLAEGELLCQLLAEKAAALSQNPAIVADALGFAPASAARLRQRGFNQAQLLAQAIARQWQRPCLALFHSPALIPHQTGLKRKERLANLAGKIQLNSGDLPAHIALVDDVVTTGATMDWLTRLLKNAGVQRVDVWSLAVTPYSAASSSPSSSAESALNILPR
ncbi:ComF family protein [Rheinheimera sp.]|uniref:ComF family protein n=1 Tax=Rheinheimera sp. TaxID=1869214 RepID=UPI00307E297B